MTIDMMFDDILGNFVISWPLGLLLLLSAPLISFRLGSLLAGRGLLVYALDTCHRLILTQCRLVFTFNYFL